jgi:hypothetical protein
MSQRQLRRLGDPAMRGRWHPHWSPVHRLDDDAARRQITWCRERRCQLEDWGVAPERPDSRYLCGYCGAAAVPTTIPAAVDGKSAACAEHADQLERSFIAGVEQRLAECFA